jgi:hypothetical protein
MQTCRLIMRNVRCEWYYSHLFPLCVRRRSGVLQHYHSCRLEAAAGADVVGILYI